MIYIAFVIFTEIELLQNVLHFVPSPSITTSNEALYPLVNFIIILRARFLYERSSFSETYLVKSTFVRKTGM
jgi:hypothetical protein